MYALDLLKVGEPAEVVFIRAGDRMTTDLIPAGAGPSRGLAGPFRFIELDDGPIYSGGDL